MTEVIISRGDTFPRTLLDSYRASKNTEFYNDLTSSKSDELVLQNPSDIPMISELQHGCSENLLDSKCLSQTNTEIFIDPQDLLIPKYRNNKRPTSSAVYDKVDPEDSIRDIVSENDFYRFVLFKKHYDKYLHLSQKYEEARNIAYYLEEKYHEIKTEKDDLIQQRNELAKRLESNECLCREKEDEVFLNLERVVYLEEQCDKLRIEKEKLLQQKTLIEKERDKTLRLLQEQARESESNRRKLERARQEVVHHLTKIKNEKEYLERENDKLKEELEAERKEIKNFNRHQDQHRRRRIIRKVPAAADEQLEGRVTELKSPGYHSSTLASQFQKAVEHLANCKVKKCSVCAYAKASYKRISPNNHHHYHHQHKYDRKLFGCLQTPFLEMRNMMLKPSSRSPINCGEGTSLSEWFCPIDDDDDDSPYTQSECSSSSLSVPFADMSISYMDDAVSETASSFLLREGKEEDDQRGDGGGGGVYGSDSGFSSDFCGDFKSTSAAANAEKFSPNGTLDEHDCAKLTRTKWTASFRKIIRKIKK